MKNKTCCFSGHRDIPQCELTYIESCLHSEIEKLIKSGVIYYGTGGARGFDTIAAQTVLELKERYPQIRLILVLPCSDQTRNWSLNDRIKYDIIKEKADKVKFLSDKYYKGCMHARNRYLVDNSSCVICYKRKNTGGTAYTVCYAKAKGINVIDV